MDDEPYDRILKLLLVGDSGVGKTSLMFKYADQIFLDQETWQTSLFDFKSKTIQMDGKLIKLQIWHARRRERYHTMTSSLASRCRGTAAIMVLYDVTDRKTFNHVSGWLRTIGSHVGDHMVRMIVGCKSDLEEERMVGRKEGEELAMEHNVDFAEVSAKDGHGVEETFQTLVRSVIEKERKSKSDDIPM